MKNLNGASSFGCDKAGALPVKYSRRRRPPVQVNAMQIFNLSQVEAESAGKNQAWLEFLRATSLSVGLYRLKAGQEDRQQPHAEDEVYYVLTGKASFNCGGQSQPVSAGSLIYVERSEEHRFCDITEDLCVLVFFAPPEGSLKKEA
jgi:mannose-6-phosphate isomerase-like protein (cupin superfamily)